MLPSDLLRLLAGDDVPALVQAIRIDLGHTPESAASILGWAPESEWGGVVRDVEDGRDPVEPFDQGYVVRGMVAAWLLQRGEWSPGAGTYTHSSGAKVSGNGTSSYASVPGQRSILTESTGALGCSGPVIRHDIIRLMLRVYAALGHGKAP